MRAPAATVGLLLTPARAATVGFLLTPARAATVGFLLIPARTAAASLAPVAPPAPAHPSFLPSLGLRAFCAAQERLGAKLPKLVEPDLDGDGRSEGLAGPLATALYA